MIRVWWAICRAGPLHLYFRACPIELANIFPYYLKAVLKGPACFLGSLIYIWSAEYSTVARNHGFTTFRYGPPGIHSVHIPPERGSGRQPYFPANKAFTMSAAWHSEPGSARQRPKVSISQQKWWTVFIWLEMSIYESQIRQSLLRTVLRDG